MLYRMQRIPVQLANQIRELRRTGHSFPEIRRITRGSAGTVHRYARDIAVSPEFAEELRNKRGGSKARSALLWNHARKKAAKLVGKVTTRDKLFILSALYWGEGTKSELNIINGDAELLRVFVNCLDAIGISKEDLRFSLRLYSDIDPHIARTSWAQVFRINPESIQIGEIIVGKKRGKLAYGMCRIRLKKGGSYFKLIMSMIESIRRETRSRSSTDRTSHS